MKIEAQSPSAGRSFHLRVTGRGRPSAAAISLLAISGVVFLCLLLWSPRLPPTVTPGTAEQVVHLVSAVKAILAVVVVGLTTLLLFQVQEFGLELTGEPDGSIHAQGSSVPGGRQIFPHAQGPYCVALIRRLRDDLALHSIGVSQQQLVATSLEDETADEELAALLRTEVSVVDGAAKEHHLLSVPGPLPAGAAGVMEALRLSSKGTLEKLRGGGWVLRLPRRIGHP